MNLEKSIIISPLSPLKGKIAINQLLKSLTTVPALMEQGVKNSTIN